MKDWAVTGRTLASCGGVAAFSYPAYLLVLPPEAAALASLIGFLGLSCAWLLPVDVGGGPRTSTGLTEKAFIDEALSEVRRMRKAAGQLRDKDFANLVYRMAEYADEGLRQLREGREVTAASRTLLAHYLPKAAEMAEAMATHEAGGSAPSEPPSAMLRVFGKLEGQFEAFAQARPKLDIRQIERDMALIEASIARVEEPR